MFIIYKKRIFIYTLRENNKIDQLSKCFSHNASILCNNKQGKQIMRKG